MGEAVAVGDPDGVGDGDAVPFLMSKTSSVLSFARFASSGLDV